MLQQQVNDVDFKDNTFFNESEITISKEEYDQLRLNASKAKQFESLKKISIWILFFIFFTCIYIAVMNKISENNDNNVQLDIYYDNELKRTQKEIDSHINNEDLKFGKIRKNYRPGRIYHRGGNYGNNFA
jgi:hypothetical protein